MESSDSDDMEESDPESPSVPDNAAPMPWEVNPRRIKDLVDADPERCRGIALVPRPKTAKEVRRFMGSASQPAPRAPSSSPKISLKIPRETMIYSPRQLAVYKPSS